MKIRILTAALAAFFMLPLLSQTAFAAPNDLPEEPVVIVENEETIAISDETSEPETLPVPVTGGYDPAVPEPTTKPFTPSGAGTVTDHATDADGKEFYTITAPDKNVFYLVIDRQRNTENVYFLNAVTVNDLLSLAEAQKPSETPQGGTVTPPPSEKPAETTPEPEPTQSGGMGTYILIAVIVILGGGAGWYFKVYRPKHQAGNADDSEYTPENTNAHDDWDEQQDGDDSPPWDVDEDESEGER